jgi:predicted AAA+ superfamily ATPase
VFIPRSIIDSILHVKNKYPVLAVTGPRQSGKTTLLRQRFPDYVYVSLENADIRERAMNDPNAFLKKYSDKVILDEVQRVPQLLSYIQTKTDQDNIMGQYILSGSQNFLFLETITQSLAGRVALFKLLPFTFSELAASNFLEDNWQSAVFKGFYPAFFDRNIEPANFYPNYLETYIERDVRNLLSVRDLRQFRLFLKLCAGHAGQLLNLHSLSTDCGISPPTAKTWLSVLESSYIVFTLSPYYRNFNKRVIKAPKLFFYDTGLVCNLLEMDSPEDVDKYFQRGSLFENFIVAEMYKQAFHGGRRPTYYFWQDSHKNEIDMIWEKSGALHLLEIKSGQTVNASFIKNLEKFIAHSDMPIESRRLVYGGNDCYSWKDIEVLGWKDVTSLE